MRNDRSAKISIQDAEIILDEAHISFKSCYYHRMMRKFQESTELAVKGLLKYLGIEYPRSHILGLIIKKEFSKIGLFSPDELKKLAYINDTLNDTLAFDREPGNLSSY
ncbi:MAG: HEPN domain-containing protein [Methanophagales archaeon]|nr:HEPN domain-containing protein [Methanophagales archaeon]